MKPVQGDLFPFAAPETVLAHCRRLEAIALSIGPELTPEQCMRMLGELSLAAMCFQEISSTVRSSRDWKAREQLAAPPPRSPSIDERIPLERARRWRTRRTPTWLLDASSSS